LRWLFPSVSSERWWSRKATRGDSADTSVCDHARGRALSKFQRWEMLAGGSVIHSFSHGSRKKFST
jgi:hypothetical protein